jgi:hypothetical protein
VATRSLADFAKLVELFDQHDVSFVSVTQQFNTTTSMGRLTLNVLLSFAQFGIVFDHFFHDRAADQRLLGRRSHAGQRREPRGDRPPRRQGRTPRPPARPARRRRVGHGPRRHAVPRVQPTVVIEIRRREVHKICRFDSSIACLLHAPHGLSNTTTLNSDW